MIGRVSVLARLAGVVAGASAFFGEPALNAQPRPAVSGDLGGSVQWPGAPVLAWRAVAARAPGSDAPIDWRGAASAEGLAVSGTGRVEGATLTWSLDDGRLQLATWWRTLLGAGAPALHVDDLDVRGEVTFSAQGTRAADAWSGRVQARLSGGEVDKGSSFQLRGIDSTVRATLAGVSVVLDEVGFAVARARVGGVLLDDGWMKARGLDAHTLQIEEAACEVLGGHARLGPVVVRWSDRGMDELVVPLKVTTLSLAQIAALAPGSIREARGTISGELVVRWHPQRGFRLGVGHLQLDAGSAASVVLAPRPGFLTESAPERVPILSPRWGPLSRWLSARNATYAPLRAIEEGRMPLRLQAFDVTLFPQGDASGRTATVRLRGRPEEAQVIGEVDFEINLFGSVDDVLRLGLAPDISLRSGG